MAAMVIVLVALGFLALFVMVMTSWSTPNKRPAIKNPKYDPEMVKFLAENGLTQQQIIATMERRNLIR